MIVPQTLVITVGVAWTESTAIHVSASLSTSALTVRITCAMKKHRHVSMAVLATWRTTRPDVIVCQRSPGIYASEKSVSMSRA